jgi:nudix-type nucleoside diphosphatase (YffH/AdpP family)
MNLFFYGTLRDAALLRIVLGNDPAAGRLTPATLPAHAVLAVAGERFPMIVARDGAEAKGVLLRDVTPEEDARLRYYEGGFDYGLRAVTLSDGQGAEVFFPDGGWQGNGPWSLERWQAEWGPIARAAAEEQMDHFGHWTPQEMLARTPMTLHRAAARVAAAQMRPDPRTERVELLKRSRTYTYFFALNDLLLKVPQRDGTMGPVMDRSVFFVGDASVVLPYDPALDCVLLTEQFRAPVWLNGDPAPWVREPVAGLVDPGETPEEAARREAVEEAGVEICALHKVGAAYSSTGSSTEFVHMFVGIATLDGAAGRGGGVAEEGEDIATMVLPYSDFIAAVDAGAFKDMPLLTCANWLARHRDRLRASA